MCVCVGGRETEELGGVERERKSSYMQKCFISIRKIILNINCLVVGVVMRFYLLKSSNSPPH